MKRKNRFGLLSGLIFLIAGAVVGFLIGTYIGGNYYPDFEFLTYRGYEATGWIGIIVGGLLGAILGVMLGRSSKNRDSYK